MMGRWLLVIWILTGPCYALERRVSLLKTDAFEISLEYLDVASMADRQWLKVRFSNTTNKPIPVQNVSIRLESDHGGLGQSDTLPINRGPGKFGRFIPSEGYVNAGELSAYSFALLGLAPKPGVAIQGRAHALVLLEDDRTVKTPVEGIPFAFTWQHPGEDGFASMQVWTKELLEHPERESPFLLGALLGVPEVSRHFSLEDLLMARERRERADSLIAHIHSRKDFDRDALVAHYLSKLNSGSLLACDDFYHMKTDFWDPSFVKPMVRIYESTEDWAGTSPLRILFRHSEHWHDDITITERLAEPILEDWGEIPTLLPEAARKHERGLRGWADAIEYLALTRSASDPADPSLS